MADTTSEIARSKRELRKSCAAAREALSSAERGAASAAIARCGIGFASPPAGAWVSAYMAMGAEADPAVLVDVLVRDGFRTCLPVVQPIGNPLVFRAWQPGEPLMARTWGIMEPAESAPLIEPDVLLVPLLAFDRAGARLGYGGGYYDRTLARLRARKTVIAIGLAFAAQELPGVPSDNHDQRLDWVLTENGPVRPAGAAR